MISLSVQTETPPMSWEAFVASHPGYSIALDGYTNSGPMYTQVSGVGPYANFDHHSHVNRLATRATCGQVLIAVRQGLFQAFRKDNAAHATVYINDPDEDTSLSWFILKNHAFCAQALNPLLNRLVMMEDALDATAGAYPFPVDLQVLGELAWIFQPYHQFRLSGRLEKRIPEEFHSIIEDVHSRIERHLAGRGQSITLDTRYERIGGGQGWTMVKEIGGQARTGMFADKIPAYVSVRERGNDRYTYVVGRLSPYIPFDLSRLYDRLNEAEGTAGSNDRWGGSDMVGGSPRVSGSKLTPEEVSKVVNDSK